MEKAVAGGRSCLWNQQYSVLRDLFYYLCGRKQRVLREYYNKDFMEAVAEADSLEEYESLYITGNLGWQFNRDATEILTQYVCKIDAQYYQGKSNVSNGRELPAYADRYHYIYPEQQAAELVEMVGDGLLVLYQGDLQYIDFSYDVVDTVGDYLLLTVQN